MLGKAAAPGPAEARGPWRFGMLRPSTAFVDARERVGLPQPFGSQGLAIGSRKTQATRDSTVTCVWRLRAA